jgi:hypothetical protein
MTAGQLKQASQNGKVSLSGNDPPIRSRENRRQTGKITVSGGLHVTLA